MQISIARRIVEAPSARGHVVVIDVMRAFTTAAYALASGAERIVLVGTPEEAFALRERLDRIDEDRATRHRVVLVGESHGRKIEGFDHGNSPAEIERTDLRGRIVVLRSSSGTQGVVSATNATAIALGSLVVASATVRWLRAHAAEATFLAMGSPYGGDGAEDDACAEWMAAKLRGGPLDEPLGTAFTLDRVRASDAAREALDPTVDWTSPADLACACRLDHFDFAMPVAREDGLLVARAVQA